MKEEIEKLKRSINRVEDKVGYLKDGVDGLEKAIKELTADLDAFIGVYSKNLPGCVQDEDIQ